MRTPVRPRFSNQSRLGRHLARPSALLLALVRRARWLWLDWLVARWDSLRQWRVSRADRAQRTDRPAIETLEPKLLLSAEFMPPGQTPAVHYQVEAPAELRSAADATGAEHAIPAAPAAVAPSVTLTGPGKAELVALNGGFILQLSGTTSASAVSLVNHDTKQVALTGITANSAVGSLDLGNADLSGDASFQSSVGSLTLGDVSKASISVGAGTDFSFKANTVADTRVVAHSANLSVTVSTWAGSSAGASRLEAAGLTALVTKGEFGADVFLSGVGGNLFTLGSVKIGGTINGGLWSVHGRANSIAAGSTAAAWRANISDTLMQLVTKGDVSGDLAVGGLQTLQAGGSARGLHLLVGANLGDDATLGGVGANADSFKPGALAHLRVDGDLVDSSIYISVDPVNGVFADGNDIQIGTVVQRLQEVIVGGHLLGSTSVVAPLFPTSVRVGGQNVDPATLPQFSSVPPDRVAPVLTRFGLAAASDTGVPGDNKTGANPVTLVGVTEAGATLTLRSGGTLLGNATAAADGSFSFTGIALDLGNNAFVLSVADAAGNTTTANLAIVRENTADITPPVLSAALASDTGGSATDGITSDPTISGSVTDDLGAAQLLAALDATTDTPTFIDITSSVQANGAFTLTRSLLDSLAGGTLAEGAHTLHLVAKDTAGNATTLDLPFSLDTQAPLIASFTLAAASDTDAPGDNRTTANPVTLQGTAEAGAVLTLRRNGSVLGSTTAAADGSFSFAGIALDVGDNAFALSAADAAGNTRLANLTVVREAIAGGDATVPTLSAALQNDTGLLAHDGVTRDPAITGRASDNIAVTQLLATLDASPGATDLIAQLQPDGSFTLSRAVLDALAGGSLADGQHTLRLIALDAAGNASAPLDITFTLDTQAPVGAGFGISAVDALDGNDAQSSAAIVTLQGTAEAGATITLAGQAANSSASGTGSFQLPGVALALGDNLVALTITDAAGNSQTLSRTLTRVQATQSDAVLDWINIVLKAIQLDVTHPQIATRVMAIQSIAVYDTIAAIQGTPAYLVQRTVSGAVDAQAAAAQAAYRVLSDLYPGQRASFDAALAISLAKVSDGAAKTAGIALGDSIARDVLAIRAGDGYLDFVDDEGSTAVGQWRATGPLFLVAEEPQWGQVTPFALGSGDQFRAPPPPALDSAEYAAAINQVQSLGSATSTTRTADQTQQAQFWADGGGSFTPPGHWDQIAAQVAASAGQSLSANARLMAQLNVAMADAAIAAWDTKYTYDFWRPITAIQNADQDGNDATTQDANWTPLLITPAHPSYVSGHSAFSAAAAGILDATFGDNTPFSTTASTLPGITRSFTSFTQAAEEAGLSRIYGGIHTQLDTEAGKVMGAQVAQAVLAKFALTRDTQPPQTVLAATPAATHTNVTLTGQVIDNLAGVAGAQIRIDGGAPIDLVLDANGNFSFTTLLATDGSADGVHSLAIVARDAAGNVAAPVSRSFTLNTLAPTVTLTSLAEGDALTITSRVTGTATAHGGSIVQLNYQLDGGLARTLPFDAASGSFDSPIVLSAQALGNHVLSVTARDSAGNVTTLTRNVQVNALLPFMLGSVTPGDGNVDIGVTQRPQILFSRAVNPATLTANSLYATGPDGSRLATTIVPAADGSFAWLFFTTPMPGGSRITVHVDGSLIRAAADGAFLDADNDGAAGGLRAVSFTTVSRTAVTGTKIVGRVVDPGADLKPMTFDDIRRGPDGVIHTPDDVFLLPIAHAKVYILGQEDKFVFTDAAGNFELDDVPAGDVKVAIDGRTAINAPSDVFFPEMVMDAKIQAGVANTLMGSMGPVEERLANSDRTEVYLPRVQSSAMQAVSDTQTTVIRVDDPKAAPQLTDLQRASLTLTVNPGSAVGFDGQTLTNAQIGISTVPPEMVKDMLPPGVLQHTFDITIQAPGVATFTQPVQITFPNVFNAAPGTQLAVLSFDHTTGMLVIDGTATVSADGLTVVSDPDSGITSPGWHGLTPPGGCGGSGGTPPAPVAPPPEGNDELTIFHPPVVLPFATGDAGMSAVSRPELTWEAPPHNPNVPPLGPIPGCDVPQHTSAGSQEPFINVTIEIDGDLDVFAKPTTGNPNAVPLTSYSFTLSPGTGEKKVLTFQGKTYQEIFGDSFFTGDRGFQLLGRDRLFGAHIKVTVVEQHADGQRTRDIYSYYQYRWVDVIDANAAATKTGDTAAFIKTLADGPGGVRSFNSVESDLPNEVETEFSADKPFSVDGAVSGKEGISWSFDPTTSTHFDTSLVIKVDDPEFPEGLEVGRLRAVGTGSPKTVVSVNTLGYQDELERVLQSLKEVPVPGSPGLSVVIYEYTGHTATTAVTTTGADGRAITTWALRPDATGNDFVPLSQQVRNSFVGFMPSDRGAGPDGVSGTTDDVFSQDQQDAMDDRASHAATAMLGEVKANFDSIVGQAVTIQESDTGADITTNWKDIPVGTGQAAGSALLDQNPALRTLVGTQGRVDPVNRVAFNKPISDAAQIWAMAEYLNINQTGVANAGVGNHLRISSPDITFAAAVADTISHEIGHTLGLNDAYIDGNFTGGTARVHKDGNAFPYDIMGNEDAHSGDLEFNHPTTDILKAAVGLGRIGQASVDAVTMLRNNFNLPNLTNGLRPDATQPRTTPEIAVRTGDFNFFGDSADLLLVGSVAADGALGASQDVTLQVKNEGVEPLVIDHVHLGIGSAFALIDAPAAGTSLAPGEQLTLTVRFDPTTEGSNEDSLIIDTNAGTAPHFALQLQGTGARVAPTAAVALGNNNLGGLKLGATASQRPDIFTVTNNGLQPLVISAASLLEGASSFTLLGLPADLATNPVTLAAGQSFSFGASFKPDHLGLQRGVIDLVTNDPAQPHLRLGVVGTGIAAVPTVQWGNDYLALENPDLPNAPALRTVSDSAGKFSYFLNAQTAYHVAGFDPATGLVTHSFGTTAVGGKGTDLTSSMVFLASTAKDSDYDGLPDDIEFAIGTNQAKKDTDKDGLDDFTEIQQGLDPLGALRIPTGVVSATPLLGSAEAVAVIGSTGNNANLTAVVATGSHGVAIVDASQIGKPKLLAQLDLPGTNTDVAVDAARQLAVVAGNEAGLHIVDISNPAAPVLRQTVQFGAAVSHGTLNDGVAYVTAGTKLLSIDINTGERRGSVDLSGLGGSDLLDVAISGSTAYTLDSGGRLRTLAITAAGFTPLGVLQLPAVGGQLFIADGVAYVGALAGGYLTVNVINASQPQLLSGTVNNVVAGNALALNGSGLVVAVGGNDNIGAAFRSLDVFSGSDPSQANTLLTRVNLPQIPKDLVLAGGLAFVADGAGGLQVVNYLAFDTQGTAPVVSIALDAADTDPSTPGVQLLEGRSVRIVPTLSDDVQVRSVELLVNGQVVSTDVSFPFELSAQAPSIAGGGAQMTVQIRATDTGGNVSLSNAITVDVVADTFAPQLLSVSVDEGARRFVVRSIDLLFDESLDLHQFTPTTVSLVRAGADGTFGTADDVAIPLTIDARSQAQFISLLPDVALQAGDYELRVNAANVVDIAGNALTSSVVRHFTILPASEVRAASGSAESPSAPSANPGQMIAIGVPFDPATARASFKVVDAGDNVSSLVVTALRSDAAKGIAYFNVPLNAVSGDAVVFSQVGTVITNFADGSFPLQIVPTLIGLQVESVAADGSSAVVVLSGTGFVDGASSEYRFGSTTVTDTSTTSGPDVNGRSVSPGVAIPNGTVRLTVPLADGVFGAVSVKTAGGTSAGFSTSLSAVNALALSGTPAKANQPSANAGQVVTLSGSGLSTTTDVLLRYSDVNGVSRVASLSPVAASADGSSAALALPNFVNGVLAVQILGSASQPLLQIVPTVTRVDIQFGTVLFGSGFVEGASSYNIAGTVVTDTATDSGNNVDVLTDNTGDNRSVTLNRTALPTHGAGNLTVTTAGGTSAPFALNTVRLTTSPLAPSLGDVAVDPVSGNLWVSDQASHLLRIDPATGQVLQTITMTAAAFGSANLGDNAGLQVLAAPMTLGGTAVAAGSLLVFNGNIGGPDRVVAVDTVSGNVIASLALDATYRLTGGAFNAANGHLYIADTSGAGNRIVELSAATGVQLGAVTTPLSLLNSAGVAIDPSTGHLWLGAAAGGSVLVEYRIDGTGALTQLRSIDATPQNINRSNVSGLSFAPDGTLWVASTRGEVYRIDTTQDGVTVATPTLSQVLATAASGTAANAAQAAANVGQVIELVGTNFGAGTRVLFNTRDGSGNLRVISQTPLLINPAGTRLQVQLPNLASTGDLRVVNIGTRDLGFGIAPDAVYRKLTVDFTASGTSSTIQFSDAGLNPQVPPTWGLDNVLVRQGGTTVFTDDFESATAAPQWSERKVNGEAVAAFGHFSGRFNSNGQQLTLSGLTAGQTYTLSFDLLVFDGWHGNNPGNGPSLFDVSVDGVSRLRESVSNDPAVDAAQTLRASAGIRLQVVPTLASRIVPDTFTLPGLLGTGFMEGASTVTIGGVALRDTDTALPLMDVGGARNDTLNFATPLRTLDGPVRITTEGGFAEISGTDFGVQLSSAFTGIFPAANNGQTLVLEGGGFTSKTLVQFQAIDDRGTLGTVTVTGGASADGKTLSVVVPALARSGTVSVLGSGTSLPLKIVPTLRAIGGTVAAGNTIVLEGSGLAASDLSISIDGRSVGSFALVSGQQLLTLVVPAGVGPGVVTVTTAGGSATLRSGADDGPVTALPTLEPAADVGDTLATALDTGLGLNQSLIVLAAVGTAAGQPNAPRDVDLFRVDLIAGEQIKLNVNGSSGVSTIVRIFDAEGHAVLSPQFFAGNNSNAPVSLRAPFSGSFYIGVSSSNNSNYDPRTPNSGIDAFSLGAYTLSLERSGTVSSHLTGITATATSGSAAQASLPAANVGQTITLSGVGLQAGDKLLFTIGNNAFNHTDPIPASFVVVPVIDLVHQTMTAVVPATAITGSVRLLRDSGGVVLQIVPTLTAVAMPSSGGSFTGGALQLTGSGFSEDASTVIAGGLRLDDFDATAAFDVIHAGNGISLTVPTGLPSGPFSVSTVGGTSAPLNISLNAVLATATSGTPIDPGRASANPGQALTLQGSGLSANSFVIFSTVDNAGNVGDVALRVSAASADGSQAQVTLPANAISGSVRLLGAATAVPLQVLPTVTDVQVQSVATDGTSAVVLITGTGFVEANCEYHFGSATVVDAGVNVGPDVSNGTVRLTVPLSNGVFGAVTVKTAGGGSSAPFSVNLASVASTALSGTPADAAQGSANAGQTITLTGSGLSTGTDVLLRFIDNNGSLHMVQLSPMAAQADGSSATLVLPAFANGAFTLQVFGSASQPLLQVVPTLSRADIQFRTLLFGSGFVEGASSYSFAGASSADTPLDPSGHIEVSSDNVDQNRQVALDRTALPAHGLGNVTVTTAGGTSAPFALNTVRLTTNLQAPSLGDVAVDPVSGNLWVSDQAFPGHLLRIDASSGQVLQTITLTSAFGSATLGNSVGLQVLSAPMLLAGTNVPSGSLLLFNGNIGGNDRVVAVDPVTGSVIASLTLDAHYALTSGIFNPSNGHLYLTEGVGAGNRIVELSATTGAQLAAVTAPFSVLTSAGLAIDPSTGHLWLGASSGGAQLVEYRIDGTGVLTVLRTLDATSQNINQNEVSGLSFAPDGTLWVASTQGELYRISTSASLLRAPAAVTEHPHRSSARLHIEP